MPIHKRFRVLKYRIPMMPDFWWTVSGRMRFGAMKYGAFGDYDLINRRRT